MQHDKEDQSSEVTIEPQLLSLGDRSIELQHLKLSLSAFELEYTIFLSRSMTMGIKS